MDIVLLARKQRFVGFALSAYDYAVGRDLTALFENDYIVDNYLVRGNFYNLTVTDGFNRRRGYQRKFIQRSFGTYLLNDTDNKVDQSYSRKQHVFDLSVENDYQASQKDIQQVEQCEYVCCKNFEIRFRN